MSASATDRHVPRKLARHVAGAGAALRPLLILAGMACAAIAMAQSTDTQPGNAAGPSPESVRAFQQFGDLLEVARAKTGNQWDRQAAATRVMIEEYYQQQGWTSEQDRFACQFDIEIAQIPPWKVQERFAKAMETFRQRYGLNDQQAARMQYMAVMGIIDIGTKHAGELVAYGQDILTNGGLNGGESDALKAARWSKLLRPVMDDAVALVNKRAPELLAILDGHQRKILQADLAANDRRVADGRRLLDKWAAGQWQMEDAGMGREMFSSQWVAAQMQRQAAAGADPPGGPEVQALQKMDPDRPDAWTAYVQAFVRRFSLDSTQTDAAHGILRELRTRAVEYFTSHRMDWQDVDRRDAETPQHDRAAIERQREVLTQPIGLMFQELKDRLDLLPTEAQRQAADPPPQPQASQPSTSRPAASRRTEPASAHRR